LRDSYVEKHLRHTPPEPELEPTNLDLEAEIPVFPLGLVGAPFSEIVFRSKNELNPYTYTEEQLDKLIRYYWNKKSQSRPLLFFDFEDLEHVYELFGQLMDLEESTSTVHVESNLDKLLNTLRYYV
jgi:hypothetical protein